MRSFTCPHCKTVNNTSDDAAVIIQCISLQCGKVFSTLGAEIERKQVGGDHYAFASIQPFDLFKAMKSSGNVFVDNARACGIKYAFRLKGDLSKQAEDLEKGAHYLSLAAKHIREQLIKPSI